MSDTALAKVDEAQTGAVVQMAPTERIVSAIVAMASDPAIDIEKMQRLMEMQQSMEDRQAKAAFNAALAAVQGELGPVLVNRSNDQTRSKYANLEAIHRAARPILAKHGMSTSFREVPPDREGYVSIIGTLRHAMGHSEEYPASVPVDGVGMKGQANKTATHAHGSSLTYARRYCLMDMLDISVTEDDDGNAGGGAAPDPAIDDEQLSDLEHLFSIEGGDIQTFCRFHNIETLADLRARHFDDAMAQIKKAGAMRRAKRAEGQ